MNRFTLNGINYEIFRKENNVPDLRRVDNISIRNKSGVLRDFLLSVGGTQDLVALYGANRLCTIVLRIDENDVPASIVTLNREATERLRKIDERNRNR